MSRMYVSIIAGVLFLIPTHLMAGGPPRLCFPIDGVNADNAETCAKRLSDALGARFGEAVMRKNEKQWYAIYALGQDVKLSEIEAALKGSDFIVPRDELRLFGHVTLEVDVRAATPETLAGELAAVENVSVSEVKRDKGVLLVTVDMPYPGFFGKQTAQFGKVPVSRELFRRNDFSSDRSTRFDPPATARKLPTYNAVRDLIASHNARLRDVHWSPNFACRVLGCVAVPAKDADAKVAN